LEEAKVVVVRKIKPRAPDFLRHMTRAKMRGKIVTKGMVFVVYRVEETIPEGEVLVTDNTRVEFR
jgi:hypothetical protein